MISLLLAAGAKVNARTAGGSTPLSLAVGLEDSNPEVAGEEWLEIVKLLLRKGASLDECTGFDRPVEEVLMNYEIQYTLHDDLLAVKALIAGVRKHGTYKRYVRAPHRDVLACRGLAMRGKLQTDDRALAFLAKQGDNGIVWNILSYWRATD